MRLLGYDAKTVTKFLLPADGDDGKQLSNVLVLVDILTATVRLSRLCSVVTWFSYSKHQIPKLPLLWEEAKVHSLSLKLLLKHGVYNVLYAFIVVLNDKPRFKTCFMNACR